MVVTIIVRAERLWLPRAALDLSVTPSINNGSNDCGSIGVRSRLGKEISSWSKKPYVLVFQLR